MQLYKYSNIKNVRFTLYSPDDVEKLAVVRIDNVRRSGNNSIYDVKMGPLESNQACVTCKQSSSNCSGHFGYIKLTLPIFHPLMFTRLEQILKLICVNCYRCIYSGVYDSLVLSGNPQARFNQLISKLKKINYCTNPDCQLEQPEIKTNSVEQQVLFNGTKNMTPSQIYYLLSNVTDEECKKMGLMCNLRGFFIFNLLVLPNAARPLLRTETLVCDDDLTIQYLDILKTNLELKAAIQNIDTEKIAALFTILKY